MRFSAVVTTLTITAATTHAATNTIHNNCAYDIWYTSVGSKNPAPPEKLSAGQYAEEEQYFDTTGTAIKITKSETGLYTSKPVLHFAYSYNKGKQIYYGLSSHAGFDFWGEKLTLGPIEGESGTVITWDGKPGVDYTAAYLGGELDLILVLCAKK
ncbi:hypothetical protein FB567DRAFT_161882 [Paraphoma chrysanthemicola]|uniref:BYS1 domain protein n=1 Tax=Paraphoma chrysanthemicola TaxID=798071 RepID=A0A8K0RES8_9PLEO|nr:hypothetical protein FB567DRAFT_161882 [Paraphoma chrysanthemicola]